jgi:thiol-disulfide isomerase/thioredoxin
MKNWTRKLEIGANIAIIMVAVLMGIVLVKKYLLTDHTEPAPEVVAGTKVSLPGVDWSKNGQTLLVVLQKGCHFCAESAPFYQRLARETSERRQVHLVAVLPQEVSEGKQYLDEMKVPIEEVKQAAPSSLGVRGTPTLILVNNSGVVVDVWQGKLLADDESKVLTRLQGNSS